jgi:hypothetical protein
MPGQARLGSALLDEAGQDRIGEGRAKTGQQLRQATQGDADRGTAQGEQSEARASSNESNDFHSRGHSCFSHEEE